MVKSLNRKQILEEAINVCTNDRQDQYGDPENSFSIIASLWTEYLGLTIKPTDVACMMALLKVGRILKGTVKADNYIDAAAYMAIAGELRDFDVSASVPVFQTGWTGSTPVSPSTIIKNEI
jgi:hypothetical protein